MDTTFLTRVSMAGWIFMAVVIGSVADVGGPAWDAISDAVKNFSGIAVVVFTAAVGIGAPPAIGFLLERCVSILLQVLDTNLWNQHSVVSFGKIVAGRYGSKSTLTSLKSSGAAFHIFFYTYADTKLLDWVRRRRTTLYSSLTSALAIVFAYIFLLVFVQSISLRVVAISALFFIVLLLHARREYYIHKEAVAFWIDTMGSEVLEKHFGQNQPVATPPTPRPSRK